MKRWWEDDPNLVYASRQRSCLPEYVDNINVAKREIEDLRVLLEVERREHEKILKELRELEFPKKDHSRGTK